MAKAKGKDLTCSMSVAGAATLEDHLNGKRKLKTIEMIKTEKYDAVILSIKETNEQAILQGWERIDREKQRQEG